MFLVCTGRGGDFNLKSVKNDSHWIVKCNLLVEGETCVAMLTLLAAQTGQAREGPRTCKGCLDSVPALSSTS